MTGDVTTDLTDTLDTRQAAAFMGLSMDTLRHWRQTGRGPAFLKIGRGRASVRYRREDLEDWVKKNVRLVRSTSEGKLA